MTEITIKCEGTRRLAIHELQDFQGELKEITEKNLEKLKKNILQEGFVAPIFVWGNKILDGHQRLKALEQLQDEGIGIPKLPVIDIKAKDETDAKRILLMINSRYGEFTDSGFIQFVENINLEDLRPQLNIPEINIKNLLNSVVRNTIGDDAVPGGWTKQVTQPGDHWSLGGEQDHYLVCGDSTKPETYEALGLQQPVDMVFTDPPYGVSYRGDNNANGRNWGVMDGDDLRDEGLTGLLLPAFQRIAEHTGDQPGIYICYASCNHTIFEKAIQDAGLRVRQQLIWAKHMVLGHSDYHWSHEPILYCSKEKRAAWYGNRAAKTVVRTAPIRDLRAMKKEELIQLIEIVRNDQTVLEIKKAQVASYIHPTQKPVQLAEVAILNSSPKGGLVLDPFLGSGTTLIAAEKTGRQGRGIELNPQFVDRIVQRFANFCKNNEIPCSIQRNGQHFDPYSDELTADRPDTQEKDK